jgi:hypothetical protein
METRARLATAAILLLVFGSGALVGMALDGGAEASTPEGVDGQPASAEAEQPERRGRIFDQVDLSARQKTTIDSIVVFHRERMRTLNDEFRDAYYPRFYGLIDETRALIKEEMTEEQAARYDSLLAEFDRKNRSEEGRLPFRRRD